MQYAKREGKCILFILKNPKEKAMPKKKCIQAKVSVIKAQVWHPNRNVHICVYRNKMAIQKQKVPRMGKIVNIHAVPHSKNHLTLYRSVYRLYIRNQQKSFNLE